MGLDFRMEIVRIAAADADVVTVVAAATELQQSWQDFYFIENFLATNIFKFTRCPTFNCIVRVRFCNRARVRVWASPYLSVSVSVSVSVCASEYGSLHALSDAVHVDVFELYSVINRDVLYSNNTHVYESRKITSHKHI